MVAIGIMIEGQNGLNWARWQRILQAAEDWGFACVFRSDHYTNPNLPDIDSLEAWVSLTYAASHTRRIEFGALVSPVTFRHPAIVARMAAAVDDLSGGRLTLGLGAGWQEREHRVFGVPFYNFTTRYAMLEEALEITTRLLRSDEPVSFSGRHFSLDGATLLPRPQRRMPLLIGGSGPKRTLPLVARFADEWNANFIPLETYKERATRLDELLVEQGRQPGDVTRSLMTGTVFGRSDGEWQRKLLGRSTTYEKAVARGLIVGTPEMWVEQIGRFAEAGVQRFMLQWLDLDDLDGLESAARGVLPQFSSDHP